MQMTYIPLEGQPDDVGTEQDRRTIGLAQIWASSVFSILAMIGHFFIATFVGDISLFLLGGVSVLVFCGPLPFVIHAVVGNHEDWRYRYFAYGLASLFASIQAFLLVLVGVFLSGATLTLLVLLNVFWIPLIAAVFPLVYCPRHRRVRLHILNGGSARDCFFPTRRTMVLSVCLVALALVFFLYASTGFRIEWAGFALIPTGLMFMVLYSREAAALSAYSTIKRLSIKGYWIRPTENGKWEIVGVDQRF